MHTNQRIVWAEGVFLGQQHFQQWEKSINEHQQFLQHYRYNKTYGLCQLVINPTKLHLGIFQVDAVVALMPDGRWLTYADESSDGLLSIALTEEMESLYLALPKSEVVRGISGYPDTRLDKTAWQAEYKACQDLYDPEKEREVLYAKQQFFLTKDLDDQKSSCLMKIAEVSQQMGGGYQLLDYIAPLLKIEASSTLLLNVSGVSTKIITLINSLRGSFQVEPSVAIRENSEQSYTLVLSTVLARYYSQLMDFENRLNTSPQALYACLRSFIFELSVCCGEKLPKLEHYQNENISKTFNNCISFIQSLFEKINPIENKKIELHQVSESLYVSGELNNKTKPSDFIYLEVCEYHDNGEWALRFERGIKLGAASKIKDIYTSAVAGVKLKHIQRPPSAISIKPNCEYFQIQTEGIYWQQVLEEGKLGVIKSQEFNSIKINLMIVSA